VNIICRVIVITFVVLALQYSLFGRMIAVQAAEPLPLSQVQYWAYQIQQLDSAGAVDELAASRYDMLVIEPTVTHNWNFDAKDMVQTLKASKAYDGIHRKLVIAYIDIGQAEEWRWYWHGRPTYEGSTKPCSEIIAEIQSWAPWVVACDPDGWGGNYPVAYWYPAWKEIVIGGTQLGAGIGSVYFDSLLDEVIQDGFDGVYLDWVEAWEMPAIQQRADEEGRDVGTEMLKFLQAIKNYGKQFNPSFLVIQQNSSELINEVGVSKLRSAVDAIAQEGVWWEGDATDNWDDESGFDQPSGNEDYYLPRLRKYRDTGFTVFVCEYANNEAADAYNKAKNEGFVAYATHRPLNQLTATPPFFSTVAAPFMLLLDK
jgi:cysteinyl-tRNA synthetase